MTNVYVDSKLSDDERRKRLYAGDIFLFFHRLRVLEYCVTLYAKC